MPELPEVETIARGVARGITGREICDVRLSRRDILHGNGGSVRRLVGRTVLDVRRCGKQIRLLVGLDDGPQDAVYVHLGMTGRLSLMACDRPVEKHTHLVVRLSGWDRELRFCDPRRFGGVWLVRHNALADTSGWRGRRLPPIGADPLELTLPDLQRMLARRRQIKPLLMGQTPICGMGNIYCDEALFRAGVHPLTPADQLDAGAVRRLRTAMRRVLTEAIRAGGSSISDYRNADNVQGRFQDRHRVYGRQGRPCRVCGSVIERFVVAGRGTHICPRCQPPPLGKTSTSAV